MFPVARQFRSTGTRSPFAQLLEGRTYRQSIAARRSLRISEGDRWARHYGYKWTCSVPCCERAKRLGPLPSAAVVELLTQKQIVLIETLPARL